MNSKKFTTVLIIIVIILAGVFGGLFLMRNGSTNRSAKTPPAATYGVPVAPAPTGAASVDPAADFDDGLGDPALTRSYELDEFGAGVASINVYTPDINGDGKRDRITKIRNENGTDHFFYEYKIELDIAGKYVDITPNEFRTVEGAECSLQKFRFVFAPNFKITKIARPWETAWDAPTMAFETVYVLDGNQLRAGPANPLRRICNVAELF